MTLSARNKLFVHCVTNTYKLCMTDTSCHPKECVYTQVFRDPLAKVRPAMAHHFSCSSYIFINVTSLSTMSIFSVTVTIHFFLLLQHGLTHSIENTARVSVSKFLKGCCRTCNVNQTICCIVKTLSSYKLQKVPKRFHIRDTSLQFCGFLLLYS